MEYHGLKFLGYGSNFHVLPTVSNLKGKSKELGNSVEQLQQHGYIYIGRSMNQGGWKLAKSKWSNPSFVKQSTREQCLLDYVNHLYESSLINIIVELERTHLMCWCHPEACHGDVLRLAISISSYYQDTHGNYFLFPPSREQLLAEVKQFLHYN